MAIEILEPMSPCPDRDLLLAEAYQRVDEREKAYALASKLFFDGSRRSLFEGKKRDKLVRILSPLIEERDAEARSLMDTELSDLGSSPRDVVKAFYLGGANRGMTLAETALQKKRAIETSLPSGRTIGDGDCFLEFLKKFSSYTPLLHHFPDESVGGGYFFCLGNYGLVIDPGHHFLDNFYRRGRCFEDIDGIAITHFHDDHFADFPSLLALIHQSGYMERLGDKKFDLFLDEETYDKFSALFESSSRYGKTIDLGTIDALEDGRISVKDGVWLEPLPAKHPSVGRKRPMGLLLTLDRKETQIFVTGDTGWDESIGRAYLERRTYDKRILVAHVSTAFPPEMRGYLEGVDVYYEKHLCVRGLTSMIETLEPSSVILSEIGEELSPVIQDLAALVEKRYGVPCIVGYDNALVNVE